MPAVLSKPDNPHKSWINKCLYGFVSGKLTLSMLKIFAKGVGLNVSGNKTTLMTRCVTYQHQQISARRIQSLFRGHITRLWIRLKQGTKSPPVNDTDFYTLEPVSNIPFNKYIHYTDPTTYTSYVFDIVSLFNLFQSNQRYENPYTRTSMNDYVETFLKIMRFTYLTQQFDIVNRDMLPNTQKLTCIERARNLFINIDLTGHYTCIDWFLDLTNTETMWFYANFYNIWKYVPQETIYPQGNLFANLTLPSANASLEHNRNAILELGETLVNCDGDRSLGVFYFLMALTTVSYNARIQYAYLYDIYEATV